VVIVSVTRGDLRDEFFMAEEAFALSPISARAAQPSEEDYDAIREAFMETSRGRWFLGEYARRNRNADTRMVLDAVARIEEGLAAQKQEPVPDNGLAEALAAIRRAVDEARAAASAAFDGLALEENLARVRKGTRIIREISWRWREIGADVRICDLLDSQVGAIDAGCDNIAATDPLIALSAAFDLIEGRIETLDDRDAAPSPAAEQATSSPSPAAAEEMAAAVAEQNTTFIADAETAVASTPSSTEVEVAAAEAADVTSDGDDGYDDAMLDLVALEMAAPDPADADDYSGASVGGATVDEIRAAEAPQPAEPEIIAPPPASVAPPTAIPTSFQPSPQPSPEPSLGSTLIANGIVRRPGPLKSDPLAPIRRMSQAEKIAFFS
jgi:hypothetical protein